MKIYTQTYDLSKAIPHRFWVAPYSDFKIGIKLLEKGELSDKDFTLKAGSTEFTPDEDKIDNYTLFTIKSDDTGFVEYTIEVEGVAEKLKLMQIVTDSTVFEVGGEGGGSGGDSYTKAQTDALLSAKADKDELSGYATEDELSTKADSTKQIPADLTSWITDGWNNVSSDEESGEDVKGQPWTKITSDFYDISQYCDYTVSAQYVAPDWTAPAVTWQNQGKVNLFSECTNGKTVAVSRQPNDIFDDYGKWEGNVSGDVSCYCEFDASKIPDGTIDGNVPISWYEETEATQKIFAYASENMDQSAPFVLQDVSEEIQGLYVATAIWHDATEDVTPGFVEVSAVYGNEISGFIDQQGLTSYIEPMLGTKVSHEAYPGEYTPPDIINMTTIYQTDWADISADADENTFYVVLPDPE